MNKSGNFTQKYESLFGIPKISFNEKVAKKTIIETKRLYLIPINKSFTDLYHKFLFGDK